MLTVSGVHERELVGLAVLRAEAHIPFREFETLFDLRHDDLPQPPERVNSASLLLLSSRRTSE
jgi:hypothetical protein